MSGLDADTRATTMVRWKFAPRKCAIRSVKYSLCRLNLPIRPEQRSCTGHYTEQPQTDKRGPRNRDDGAGVMTRTEHRGDNHHHRGGPMAEGRVDDRTIVVNPPNVE